MTQNAKRRTLRLGRCADVGASAPLWALSWHVGPEQHDKPEAEWGFDPDLSKASEVEIRFTAEGGGLTLVELTHSKLERHGGDTEKLRAMFDGPTAWAGILHLYAKKIDEKEGA